MLVITRKKNESVVINGEITIHFIEVGSRKVKIAIDAPRDMVILRTELLDKNKKPERDSPLYE
jgi:carbon storage regulator